MTTKEQLEEARKVIRQYYEERCVRKQDTSEMIKQVCLICGKNFEGKVKIDICPNCYV